jgi:hypothetical protein
MLFSNHSGGSIGLARAADVPRYRVTSAESAAIALFTDIPSCFWNNEYMVMVRGMQMFGNNR